MYVTEEEEMEKKIKEKRDMNIWSERVKQF